MSGMLNTPTNSSNFAVLKLAVNPDNNELVELYKQHVDKHNASLKSDPFPNSGFDIFVPENRDGIFRGGNQYHSNMCLYGISTFEYVQDAAHARQPYRHY